MPPNDEPTSGAQEIKVSIETRDCTIVGTVHLQAMAYRGRLSDQLNQKERFLNVTNATVYSPRDASEPAYSAPYLAVNLGRIDIVRPLE